jgi:hypothetical protein
MREKFPARVVENGSRSFVLDKLEDLIRGYVQELGHRGKT